MNGRIKSFDERRNIIIPGNLQEAISFSVDQFLELAKEETASGLFSVALSGGSTPKAIYKALSHDPRKNEIDWKKVLIFFSDERAVSPISSDSNYHMAMESGIGSLPIPKKNIFRMPAESEIEQNAKVYEAEILTHVPKKSFSLVMLGMGEDGHTASLFPETHALHAAGRLVIANFIPQKSTWRMTLSYECINSAKQISLYVLGKDKASMVNRVLTGPYTPDLLPVQKIGTPENKALWILDTESASKLEGSLK